MSTDSGNLLYAVATTVKASGVCSVKVGSQIVQANCPTALTVAVGDVLIVAKVGSTYFVVQSYFTTGVGNTNPGLGSPEPPAAPVTRTGTNTFLPVRTASWRDAFGGWRTDNDSIYQGEFGGNGNHIGCAFYGSQVKTLAGATVTGAYIQAKRLDGGVFAAQATTLGHIAEFSKPSGMPTFAGSFTGPNLAVGGSSTNIVITTSLAQSLVDGTFGGLGINVAGGTPYVRLAGLSDFPNSFALTISWSK